MAVMEITQIGHEVLRQEAEPVQKVTKKTQALVRDMIETMYAAEGVGLAAPQVGISQRIIVLDVGDGPIAMINPEITAQEGTEIDVEGCLSIPGRHGYVKRWIQVTVQYLDEKGKPHRVVADGLLARAIQHELDHLNGVLFVDIMLEEAKLKTEEVPVEERLEQESR